MLKNFTQTDYFVQYKDPGETWASYYGRKPYVLKDPQQAFVHMNEAMKVYKKAKFRVIRQVTEVTYHVVVKKNHE